VIEVLAPGWLDAIASSRKSFVRLFVVGPLLMASFIPTMLFGLLLGQWGSNLVWGSVFGLGWCLAAFAADGLILNKTVAWIGLAWGWGVPIPLYLLANWLSVRLSPRGRRLAVGALLASFLLNIPAQTLMAWDRHGIHFPDYSLHMAESY
jgi:hypothetical protein